MRIDYNDKELASFEAYKRGDIDEANRIEDEFLEDLRKSVNSGEDHCSCARPCRHHGKCLECVAIHRAHMDHLPYCLFNIVNERLYNASGITEHTIIGKIKEERKKK